MASSFKLYDTDTAAALAYDFQREFWLIDRRRSTTRRNYEKRYTLGTRGFAIDITSPEPEMRSISGNYVPEGFMIAKDSYPHWYKAIEDVKALEGKIYDLDYINYRAGKYLFYEADFDEEAIGHFLDSGDASVKIPFNLKFIEVEGKITYPTI